MKFCPNCGAPIEESHKFCANCGEKLPVMELPKEPVYTDDPALLSNPALQSTPAPVPPAQEEKVPELTLEPDLWGMPPAAKPAEAAAPAAASVTATAAAPAAAAAVQAPSYASVMEGVEYDNDYRREQEERRKREEARRLWEEEQRRRQEAAAQNPRPDNVPNDYTMSQSAPVEEEVPQLPDETLMLIWSIILTVLCSIPGIVGLVKTIKARKAVSLVQKAKLLSSAKIWLIIGTAFYALAFIGNLF